MLYYIIFRGGGRKNYKIILIMPKEKKSNYQKYRGYFLNYHQKRKTRKYPFCEICGLENNQRYNKVCSSICSKALRQITVQGCVEKHLTKKTNWQLHTKT